MSNLSPHSSFYALQELLGDCICRLEHTFCAPAPSGWRIIDRTLDLFHMVMLRDGRAYYRIQDRVVPMKTGTLVLIGPGVSHGVEADPRFMPQICTTRFRLVRRGDGTLGGADFPPFAVVQESANVRQRLGWYEELNEAFLNASNRLCQLLAENALRTLLLSVLQQMSQTEKTLPRGGMAEVLSRLQSKPEEVVSGEELARMARLSAKHFYRQFKAQTGMAPHQYQIRMRCQKAQMLLTETGMTIKEIAYALGYPDAFSFSKQFRQMIGCPPTRFRQQRDVTANQPLL